tara:strand:- start:21843 stop:25061 length:3219 start_codon:yes stop_codon:yes gene_type:complete
MARYPQGVSSFIPTYQAYQPDFTTMGKMLSIKQNQYDQSWKQLNKVYSSLYYSDTTHADSQEVKDQLKNEIDFNLKRVSGLDLSLDSNVQAASQVFQPFYENSSLMYDMAATKNVNAAKSRARGYQNSSDPKKSKLFWQDGVKEIDYRIQEFKDTAYDEIQGTGLASVGYTKYVDVGKMAEDMAKEFGDISVPSMSADGRYQIQTTNGPAILMQPLSQLYQMRMANDPGIQAMYKTQAYVDRKDFMYGNASQYNGDASLAERAYLENEYNILKDGIDKRSNSLATQSKALSTQQEILSNGLNNGTAPSGTEQTLNDITTNKDIINADEAQTQVEKDMVSGGVKTASTSQGETNPFSDINTLRNKVDFLRANTLMRKDFQEAAYIYSQRNMSTKRTADPYALADYKSKLTRETDRIKATAEQKFKTDEWLVKSGTHVFQVNKDGSRTAVAVDPANNWQTVGPESGTTVGETDMSQLASDELNTEWRQSTSGIIQGIDILTSIAYEDLDSTKNVINPILNKGYFITESGEKEALTFDRVKSALSLDFNAFREKTGLSLTDARDLNKAILNITQTDEVASNLINAKFSTSAEQAKITSYKQNAINTNVLLNGSVAIKNWMTESTNNLLTKASQSTGNLKNAYLLVDKNTGAVLDEETYYENAINQIIANSDAGIGSQIQAELVRAKAYRAKQDSLTETRWNDKEGKYEKIDTTTGKVIPQKVRERSLYGDIWDTITRIPSLFGSLAVADYEDVKEAWLTEWKDGSNFKTPPPFTTGTGTGVSGMRNQIRVIPQAAHGAGTMEFYEYGGRNGIINDYRNLDKDYDITFSSVGTGSTAENIEVNTTEAKEIVKQIWDSFGDQGNFKVGEGFNLIISPTTGISGNKGAYTIMPTADQLDKFMPETSGQSDDEKVLYGQIRSDILSNGATIITDRSNFKSSSFDEVTTNPIEAQLKYLANSTKKDASITQAVEPGYSMNFNLDQGTKNYSMSTNFKAFDLNTYLTTGKLTDASVDAPLTSGETLYTQLQQYISSQIPVAKAANQERVNLVRQLRKMKPDITNAEITKVFNDYTGFQYSM